MNDETDMLTGEAEPPEEADSEADEGIVMDGDHVKATVCEALDSLHGLYVRREDDDDALPSLKGRALAKAEKALAKVGEEIEAGWTFISMRIPDDAALLRLRSIFEAVFHGDGEKTFPAMYDEALTPPAEPLPEYPRCGCGAALVLPAEQAAGKCEACAPTLNVEAGVAATSADATTDAPGAAPASAPIDVLLPFPPAPVPPFDFHAAFVDIAKKTRGVEAYQKTYQELADRTKDAKKQWEAAASSLTLAITEYDRKARESEEYAERQERLQAAYVEKLEAEAAAKAAPELPLDQSRGKDAQSRAMADERVSGPATKSGPLPEVDASAYPEGATPLQDALPTCGLCENVLALDTEKDAGICEGCSGKG